MSPEARLAPPRSLAAPAHSAAAHGHASPAPHLRRPPRTCDARPALATPAPLRSLDSSSPPHPHCASTKRRLAPTTNCGTDLHPGVLGALARLGGVLSIGKLAAGPGAGRYYVEQVAQGREDYYAGEGEAPGAWVGGGRGVARARAARSARTGSRGCSSAAIRRSGEPLRRPLASGAVAGFDLTFRAPKSVSVLFGRRRGRRRARGARRRTTRRSREALGYLEREACRARRGARRRDAGARATGSSRRRSGTASSRAGDPLLHTHVVVAQRDAAARTGAGRRSTAALLYRHAKTAGYLYQAALRAELTRAARRASGTRSSTGAADLARRAARR